MAKVKLLQRFGDHQPGETVDVDDTTARWLVGISRGETAKDQAPQNSNRVHPGGDGADPVAGGDPTRLRPIDTPRVARRDNHALPVPGSPVQYNAGVRTDDGHQSGRQAAKQAAQKNRDANRPAEAPSSEERKATTARKPAAPNSSKAAASEGKQRPGES